jgi:hypothetical protein
MLFRGLFMSMKHAILCAAALAGAAIPAAANAAVTVNITQSGADVVATATGTLDLTGLTSQGSFFLSEFIRPDVGYVGLGADGSVSGYSGFTGPTNFGPADITDSSSRSGTSFALNSSSFGSPYVFVPIGYVSGSAISGTATWLGTTIGALGANPGTYVYTSAHDTVTIIIGSVPEPSTWAMMLIGFGAIGFAMRRKSMRRVAIA